jgi:hypothetical protein
VWCGVKINDIFTFSAGTTWMLAALPSLQHCNQPPADKSTDLRNCNKSGVNKDYFCVRKHIKTIQAKNL